MSIPNSILQPDRDRFSVNSRERIGSLERDKPASTQATENEIAGGHSTASSTGDTTNPYPIKTPSTLIEGTVAITTAIAAAVSFTVKRDGVTVATLSVPAGSTVAHDNTLEVGFSQGTMNTLTVAVASDGGGGYGAWTIKLLFRS